MQAPLLVRPMLDAERAALEAGLRSSDAFVLRRCQILVASARREHVPASARHLGCSEQAVRNVLHAFNRSGVAALRAGSSRPHTVHAAFDAEQAERPRAMRHPRPRAFGTATSRWTLPLAAEVACDEGLTPARVSGATVRATLARLGVRWRRAQHWISSPDPESARKNAGATA